MSKLFRKIFQWKRHRPIPSTFDALRRKLGAKAFEELSSQCLDKRFLFTRAAEELETTELNLLSELSGKIGHPFLSRVLPMDLLALPEGFTLTTFRDRGAVGITREGLLIGAVGIDPAQLQPLFPRAGAQHLAVSSWEQISKALARSEEEFRKRESRVDFREQFSAVWQVMLRELEKHGGSDLRLHLGEKDEVTYSFLVPNRLSRASGTIHSSLRGELEAALQNGSLQGERLRAVLPSGEQGVYQILLHGGEPAVETLSLAPSPTPAPSADYVMVIDDNAGFAQILQRFFDRGAIRSVFYRDARDALADLVEPENYPAAIICDLHMPRLGGDEFLRALRKLGNPAPVVMLTSDSEPETELRLIQLGAAVFLRKSQDPRLLCAHVERFIRSTKSREAA